MSKASGTAVCDGEHAQALERWQDTKDNACLQLYAARVLRTQGRVADARAAADALAASPVVHKRDRALVEASATPCEADSAEVVGPRVVLHLDVVQEARGGAGVGGRSSQGWMTSPPSRLAHRLKHE